MKLRRRSHLHQRILHPMPRAKALTALALEPDVHLMTILRRSHLHLRRAVAPIMCQFHLMPWVMELVVRPKTILGRSHPNMEVVMMTIPRILQLHPSLVLPSKVEVQMRPVHTLPHLVA
jgi:hypothetical protein